MAFERAKIKHNALDPFLTVAAGLDKSTGKGIWEEEPVSIEVFVCDKKYLNQKWNGKVGCRPAILEVLKDVADEKIREAICLIGKGGGKDYLASIIHLYGIYKALCLYDPQSFYGLSPGSPIYLVNVARNESQSKNVFFAQFLGMLENCPWFRGKYHEPSSVRVEFDKGICALSGNSQAFGWLGYNTIQWVGDELAFFLENDSDDDSRSMAEECWEAAYGSCQTRFPKHYKMIGITTPRYDDDFVMKKGEELSGRDDGYFVQKATWDVHPNLTKEDFKFALARDYRRAMRDFGAQPVGVIEGFWQDPEFVEMNVCQTCRGCQVYKERKQSTNDYACRENEECRANPYLGNGEWAEWFVPYVDAIYTMHFDLSKNKDRMGFSMSHSVGMVKIELDIFELANKVNPMEHDSIKDLSENDRFVEKSLIKIDTIGWIDPKSSQDLAMLKNKEIHYHSILNKIIIPLKDKGFNIVRITFDQFNSVYIKQQLDDMGFITDLLSCDRTDEVPVNAKLAFTENRVEYPYVKMLCDEAKKLKYVKGKKVDHPQGGYGKESSGDRKGSKDIWDSVASTIWNTELESKNCGACVDCTPETED